MLRDSTVAVVRSRPRAIPLAMMAMRKSTHGFPFVSYIWDVYGAPLGGPSSINLAYLKLARWRTLCRFPTLVLLLLFRGGCVDRKSSTE